MKPKEGISKFWGNFHKYQEIRTVTWLVLTYLGKQRGQDTCLFKHLKKVLYTHWKCCKVPALVHMMPQQDTG